MISSNRERVNSVTESSLTVKSEILNEINILSLPEELLCKIFSLLERDPHALCTLRLVNKQWNRIAQGFLPFALRSLCQCLYPLPLGQLNSQRTYLQSMSVRSPLVIYYSENTDRDALQCYDYLTKQTNTIDLGYTKHSFSLSINEKIYIGSDRGLDVFDSKEKTIRNLGDVEVSLLITHIFVPDADKKRIAFTGETAHSIKIIDLETENILEIVDRRTYDRYCCDLAFIGEYLVAAYFDTSRLMQNYIVVYDSEGQEVAKQSYSSRPCQITADDTYLAVYFEPHEMKILDPLTLKEKCNLTVEAGISDLNYYDSGPSVFKIYQNKLFINIKGKFKIFDLRRGQLIQEFMRSDNTRINCSAYNAICIQDHIVALGVCLPENQQGVELWNVETGKKVHTFVTIARPKIIELDLGIKPQLTVGNEKGSIQIWNLDIESEHTKKREEQILRAKTYNATRKKLKKNQFSKKSLFNRVFSRIKYFVKSFFLRLKFFQKKSNNGQLEDVTS